jgi:hypothetical protein
LVYGFLVDVRAGGASLRVVRVDVADADDEAAGLGVHRIW